MANSIDEVPLFPPVHTKRISLVLASLFLYSVAMFTLPFIAFFAVQHLLTEVYPIERYIANVWSVIAAVVVVNLIICLYAYKAYHEKEYDDEGNVIDQHSYPAVAQETQTQQSEKSGLNKQD